MEVSEARRLKELDNENRRLKHLCRFSLRRKFCEAQTTRYARFAVVHENS